MSKVTTTIYLHSSKESNWEIAERLGLNEEATMRFRYALCEVAMGVEVDTETGMARIVTVDGRPLRDA